MWILPIYPILNSNDLDLLISKYNEVSGGDDSQLRQGGSDKDIELMIFYMVMALGAVNAANTIQQIRIPSDQKALLDFSASRPSPTSLCTRVLRLIDYNSHILRPSIGFIQVFSLISIYSSYGPIGSSQWQLAGFAMRMAVEIGLHCTPESSDHSDEANDKRNRVFWTIYAIEISLAYNLGRPSSIGEDHIASALPKPTRENLSSLHHVRHRQIQSRIVAQIYGINSSTRNMPVEKKQMLISDLQRELDEWQVNIPVDSQYDVTYPYSYWNRLYHGTTFVLHRPSPLCSRPSVQSLERCTRSAGSYIDEVLKILRLSNIPLSWMLVQGVLFAGLTMLITVRTGLHQLLSHVEASFLLIDLQSWIRNCSICLAIMNERLQEELLSKLDSQYELLANDTLKLVSSTMTSRARTISGGNSAFATNIESDLEPEQGLHIDTSYSGMSFGEEYDYFEIFREFMGQDPTQTFWNIFPNEMNIAPDIDPGNTTTNLFW
ncbi:fungal-specific transcription factor domain-containing protein [Trichoderma evansii]